MGDRANIVLKEGNEQICLYTHWSGYKLPEILRTALIRGKERWDDFQYLTRIIFCEMLKGDSDGLEGLTGYGITQQPWDGDDRIIVVENQTVSRGQMSRDKDRIISGGEKKYPFEEYIKGNPSEFIWGE